MQPSSSDRRAIRPIPSSIPVQLDEELFYADLRRDEPDLPAWEDLPTPQRDVVSAQVWKVWIASRVACAMVKRHINQG